ncbi:MAG: hypothetical protein D3914_10360 [Candidatus Electrothrix sp. LOE2]|nr:hypothetical protein [Candidatus Electrothrix sp. LOE2]
MKKEKSGMLSTGDTAGKIFSGSNDPERWLKPVIRIAAEEKRGEKKEQTKKGKLMFRAGGVQRTFFPINGITHTVNNPHYVTTALSDI